MKWVADECVDAEVVSRLRDAGHEVYYIAEASPGVQDDEVLRLAEAQAAVLLTYDKDFGELVFRQRKATHGVVLARLPGLSASAKADVVAVAVAMHGEEFVESFTVVTDKLVRIRRPAS